MAQTVTIQRGQGTVQATSMGGANGQNGTNLTMITAPAGVSRVILNQLTICQTSPAPINTSAVTDTPTGQTNVAVYLNNNYNGDGSTRNAATVGYTATGANISRIAFPAGIYNAPKTGNSTDTAVSGPLFTSTSGPNPGTYTWYTPSAYGSMPTADAMVPSQTTWCMSPSNIYMGQYDTLSIRVMSATTSNSSSFCTYAVTWSFTLITET